MAVAAIGYEDTNKTTMSISEIAGRIKLTFDYQNSGPINFFKCDISFRYNHKSHCPCGMDRYYKLVRNQAIVGCSGGLLQVL